MNRELEPAALLPAIASVAGGLVVSLVLAEAARAAAEHELAETLRQWEHAPAPNGREPAADWPTPTAGVPEAP